MRATVLLGVAAVSLLSPLAAGAAPARALIFGEARGDGEAANLDAAWKAASRSPLLAKELRLAPGYPRLVGGGKDAGFGAPGTRYLLLGVCEEREALRLLRVVQNVRNDAEARPVGGSARGCPTFLSFHRFPVNDGPGFSYVDAAGAVAIPGPFAAAEHFDSGELEFATGHADPAPSDERSAAEFTEGLAAVLRDGRWSYIDRTGATVVRVPTLDEFPTGLCGSEPPRTLRPGHFEKGRAEIVVVCKDARRSFHFIDRAGHLYDRDLPRDVLLPSVEPGSKRVGFIDHAGNLVVPRRFEETSGFQDGLAFVRQGGKFGVIDPSGRIVIPPRFDSGSYFAGDYAPVQVDGRWGCIDRTGREVIPPRYDDMGAFRAGLAWFTRGDRMGVVDVAGREVVPPEHAYVEPLASGRMFVKDGDRLQLLDRSGRPDPKAYSGGLQIIDHGKTNFVVRPDGRSEGPVGLVDEFGKLVLPFAYENITFVIDGDQWGDIPPDHVPRLFLHQRGKVRGMASLSGKVLLAPAAGYTVEGWLARDRLLVKKDDRVYVMTAEGEVLSRSASRSIEPFSGDGLAATFSPDGRTARYVDTSGRIVLTVPGVKEIGAFEGGLAACASGESSAPYGIIDRRGRWVVPPTFARVYHSEGALQVKERCGDGDCAELSLLAPSGRFIWSATGAADAASGHLIVIGGEGAGATDALQAWKRLRARDVWPEKGYPRAIGWKDATGLHTEVPIAVMGMCTDAWTGRIFQELFQLALPETHLRSVKRASFQESCPTLQTLAENDPSYGPRPPGTLVLSAPFGSWSSTLRWKITAPRAATTTASGTWYEGLWVRIQDGDYTITMDALGPVRAGDKREPGAPRLRPRVELLGSRRYLIVLSEAESGGKSRRRTTLYYPLGAHLAPLLELEGDQGFEALDVDGDELVARPAADPTGRAERFELDRETFRFERSRKAAPASAAARREPIRFPACAFAWCDCVRSDALVSEVTLHAEPDAASPVLRTLPAGARISGAGFLGVVRQPGLVSGRYPFLRRGVDGACELWNEGRVEPAWCADLDIGSEGSGPEYWVRIQTPEGLTGYTEDGDALDRGMVGGAGRCVFE